MASMNIFLLNKKYLYCVIVAMCLPTAVFAQEDVDNNYFKKDVASTADSWFLTGNFMIDSIFIIDGITLYNVTCTDTTDLKWGGHFNLVHNYYGIRFTVFVPDNQEVSSSILVREGEIYSVRMSPYSGVWRLHGCYDEVPRFEKIYRNDGKPVYVSYNVIYNQLMVSSNFNGGYYIPQ